MHKKTKRVALNPKHPWDYPIFCPRVGECPPELIKQERIEDSERDLIRIMKDGDQVIAAYKLNPNSQLNYEIAYIQVLEEYRGAGIGKWLLAHAIGVIETKGGREVQVKCSNQPWLNRFGFTQKSSSELCYHIYPE